MNVLKVGGSATVIFEDGKVITIPECSDETFFKLATKEFSFDEVMRMVNPEYVNTEELKRFISEESEWLALRGSSVIMPSVCQLSIPEDFVEKFELRLHHLLSLLLQTSQQNLLGYSAGIQKA